MIAILLVGHIRSDSTLDGNGVAFTALRLPGCKLVELRDKLDPLPPKSGGADGTEQEGDDDDDGSTKKPVTVESILSAPRPDDPDPRGPKVLDSTVPSFAEEDEAREAALVKRDRGVWGSLGGFRHLRYVDVAYNRLSSVEQLAALPSLLAVDASGNRLAGLPDLSHARFLQVINVAINRLKRLDGRATVRPPPPTPPKEGDEGEGEGKEDDEDDEGEGEDGGAAAGGADGEEEAKEGEEEPPVDPREQAATPFVSWSLRQLILNGNPLESLHGLASPCCPRLLRLEATACKLTTLRDLATPLSASKAPALPPAAAGEDEEPEDEEAAAAQRRAALEVIDEELVEGPDEGSLVTIDQLDEGTRMGKANAMIARISDGEPQEGPLDPLAAGGGAGADGDAAPSPGEDGSPFQADEKDVWGALPAPSEDERLAEKLRELGPGGLPSLRELLVGRNAITSLAGINRECPQLRLLVAQSNRLSSLRALVTGIDEEIEAQRKAKEEAAAKEEEGGGGGGEEGEDGDEGAGEEPEEEEAPEDELAGEDFGLPTDRSARLLGRAATLVRQGAGPTEAAQQAREAVEAAPLGSVAARTPAFTGESVPGLRNLTALDVSGNEGLASLQDLYYLRALPALESVDFTGCPLADEGSGIMTEVLLRVGTHIKRVNGEFVTRAALDEAAEARKERLQQRQDWRQEKEDERRQREEERKQREEEERLAAEAAAAEGEEDDE